MKKSLIFLGMLAVGYANAQQGKVGVNTENAQATLEVNPSKVNAYEMSTTNEGILAPRLSKTRIANIASPVEGTLVYATDNVLSAFISDLQRVKVQNITEKGYYYYNGTEWVKTSGANGNIYTTNGKIIEDRTITFEQNGRLNLLGTANIGKNAEAMGIVGQDHTYFGFYPQGLNEGRKAFMGFPTTGNKNLTIANENEGGRIILRNATQVGENAESLRIVGQDHTYFGFYPQGVNEGRKAFMGFNTTGAKDLTIQNENENGKINLNNPTKVTGDLTASSLAGTGDRPVVAAADGTLKIGTASTTPAIAPFRYLEITNNNYSNNYEWAINSKDNQGYVYIPENFKHLQGYGNRVYLYLKDAPIGFSCVVVNLTNNSLDFFKYSEYTVNTPEANAEGVKFVVPTGYKAAFRAKGSAVGIIKHGPNEFTLTGDLAPAN